MFQAERKATVEYIDYGNKETVSFDDIRLRTKLTHIPSLSHEVKLSKIKPPVRFH